MLDFYKIPDETSKPDWPEKINLEWVDGLELNDFDDLKNKGLIAERFDFWTDFRWNRKSTLELYDLILKKYPELREDKLTIKSVNKLFNIVDNAVKENIGLIAYCD